MYRKISIGLLLVSCTFITANILAMPINKVNMNNIHLKDKSCVPCKNKTSQLNNESKNNLLAELNSNWIINESGHLYKKYSLKNFKEAMQFANKIAIIAENEHHHPNLLISWGICSVEIWTHAIAGLTENDFILAAKIENIKI